VSEDDDVYVLGDLMLGDNNIGIDCISRLNGHIHIVLGNHDTPTRHSLYLEMPNVWEVEWAIMFPYKKYHFFLTHFPCMTGNLEKESLKQMTLNLYGHTHQKTNFYEDRPYMYHVGVDSHDGCPVLLDDIIQEMKDKVKECIDFLDEESAAAGDPPVETVESRCHKCVFDMNTCGQSDYYGNCPSYHRDPPDGGFYG
jgi:calcineurin-like phosphoesterase family protein